MTQTINLADYLPSAAQGEPIRGAAALIRRIAEAAPSGTILDARSLKGTVLLESDPFAGLTGAPIELLTGETIFSVDFNQTFISLPSRLRWRMEGTQIRPTRPIQAISSDASPAAAMVATAIYGGYCTVSDGGTTLAVDDPSGLQIGSRIAVFGTQPDSSVAFRLERPLLASQSGVLPLAGDIEKVIGNSRVYLMIGQETLLATVSNGSARIVERGATGSRPADHARGSPVLLLRSAIATIAQVKGKLVRLETALPRLPTRSIFKAGAVDVSLSGDGLISGDDRAGSGGLYSALASSLSSGFQCSGGLRLARTSHGGLMLFGAFGANISLKAVTEVGRRSERLGASIWLFGETKDSTITAEMLDQGNLGIAIDNKSFGVSYFGLDGPPRRNHVEVGAITDHLAGIQISGAQDNRCHIGHLDARESDVIVDAGGSQSTIPIPTYGNTVVIERQSARRPDTIHPGNQVIRF